MRRLKCNDRKIAKWTKKIERCQERPNCPAWKIAAWEKKLQKCEGDEDKRSNGDEVPQINQSQSTTGLLNAFEIGSKIFLDL